MSEKISNTSNDNRANHLHGAIQCNNSLLLVSSEPGSAAWYLDLVPLPSPSSATAPNLSLLLLHCQDLTSLRPISAALLFRCSNLEACPDPEP